MNQLNLEDFHREENNLYLNLSKFQHFTNINFPLELKGHHHVQIMMYIKNHNNINDIIHILYWYDILAVHSFRIQHKNRIYDENSFNELKKVLPSFILLNTTDFNEYYEIIKNFKMNFPSEIPYALQCIHDKIKNK